MNRTLELSDEVYKQLEQQAKARGVTPSQLVAQLQDELERVRWAVARERLRAQGLLAEPVSATPMAFKPIFVQGKPLSEVILEERC